MTFAKPEKKSDDFDDDSKRYCSYPGCQNLWSVKIDKRLCSHHAWDVPKPKRQIPQNYYEKDTDF